VRESCYIDLNHVASTGMQTYPGLSLVEFFDYAPRFSNTALIDEATMLGITSTYIDAPYHIDPLRSAAPNGGAIIRPSARFRMIPSLTAVALRGLAHSGWRLLHK
jgi:hypothetical protein